MQRIELFGRDLDLLVVLRALLEDGGVTPASRRLGLSPSAVSHALSRLRREFGDPLLAREGNAMVPTPRALSLLPELKRVLEDVEGLYRRTPAFDPARSVRRFTIATSDLAAPLLLQALGSLANEAPGLSFDVRPEAPAGSTQPFATDAVDLGLHARAAFSPQLRVRDIGVVRFAVLARRGHPFLSRPTRAAWAASGHVTIATPNPGPGFVGEAAAREGVERRVVLRVSSFLLAVHAVAETDLLLAAPREIAAPLAAKIGLVWAPLPLSMPPLPVAVAWHPRLDADAGHAWFRDRVCQRLTAHLTARRSRSTRSRPRQR